MRVTHFRSGANSAPQSNEQGWDFTPMDVLRALPGVTETNYHQLAAKVMCLQDLFVMSMAAMQAIIGAENGRKLHNFINTQASSAARCLPLLHTNSDAHAQAPSSL